MIAFVLVASQVFGRFAAAQSAVTAIGLTQLASLDRRPKEAKLFQHLPPEPAGWSVTRTANFRIRHRGSPALAERIARAAEQARTAAFLRWFAEVSPSWQPCCELYLYPSGTTFRRATGVPEAVPGVSTVRREAGRVVARSIDLRADAEHLVDAILPHEVTHLVMADHFGGRLPPWANEGMAVQGEPRSRARLHLCHLPHYRQQDQLFSVRRLVQLDGYPTSQQMGPFYAQSVSLVEFLTREKGCQTLVQFLRDARSGGQEKALRRHYGCDFQELNRRWLRYAFGSDS